MGQRLSFHTLGIRATFIRWSFASSSCLIAVGSFDILRSKEGELGCSKRREPTARFSGLPHNNALDQTGRSCHVPCDAARAAPILVPQLSADVSVRHEGARGHERRVDTE